MITVYFFTISICRYWLFNPEDFVIPDIVNKYTVITLEEFIHKFYYYVLIFIELYFSNFIPVTCFSVMIPDAV